jgi:hypothetical protein
VIGDAFLLCAKRRDFDIKSNRRRRLRIRIASSVLLRFAHLVCIARAAIETMIAFGAW